MATARLRPRRPARLPKPVVTVRFPDSFPQVFFRVTVDGEVLYLRSDDTLVLGEPGTVVEIELAREQVADRFPPVTWVMPDGS